jgi:hypothetical protein
MALPEELIEHIIRMLFNLGNEQVDPGCTSNLLQVLIL